MLALYANRCQWLFSIRSLVQITIIYIQKYFEANASNFVVSTVLANNLAPLGARAYAGKAITSSKSCTYSAPTLQSSGLNGHNFMDCLIQSRHSRGLILISSSFTSLLHKSENKYTNKAFPTTGTVCHILPFRTKYYSIYSYFDNKTFDPCHMGWVGLWGFLWWAKRRDHHGESSGWSNTWFHSILAYLVQNMSRSQLYLGFGHFGWILSFFRSITFWQVYG